MTEFCCAPGLTPQDVAKALAETLADALREVSPQPAADAPNFGLGAMQGGRAGNVVFARLGRIFDLLPIGILVGLESAAIYANRFLLDLVGRADLGRALAEGALEGLLDAPPRLPHVGGEMIELSGRGRVPSSLLVVRRKIEWGAREAELVTLQLCAEIDRASLEARLVAAERKAHELDDARRRAEHANVLKSDFLAKVSHEIRTPLNAILGFAEVILEERFGPLGNARYADYLKHIHSSGALVMSLADDLLDLSKIEAGKMDLAFTEVDANRVVADCVSIMQPQANRAGVAMSLTLASDLPPIFADERSLRQITLNLLSNAVKFNRPGGQVVVATAPAEQGRAILRIRDTGVGMAETDIDLALEPFRQLDASKQSGGAGLGLPLTKALVEANRASFKITSKRNEGTQVEVIFASTPDQTG